MHAQLDAALAALDGIVLSIATTAADALTVLLQTPEYKLEEGVWCQRENRWQSWTRLGPFSDAS